VEGVDGKTATPPPPVWKLEGPGRARERGGAGAALSRFLGPYFRACGGEIGANGRNPFSEHFNGFRTV